MTDFDLIVIGAGLTGTSIAYGAMRSGARVLLLDEGDAAFRASRGSFGLIWVMAKGSGRPEYTRLCMRASELWGEFAAELEDATGVDIGYARPGGVLVSVTPKELANFKALIDGIQQDSPTRNYQFEPLTGSELAKFLPGVNTDLPGGYYSPYEGLVHPLFLLRALHQGFVGGGGIYRSDHGVTRISAMNGEIEVDAGGGTYRGRRVVIAAGVMCTQLAAMVGVNAPVLPVHGQGMVTERVKQFFKLPTNILRQTREGTLMVAGSQNDFGYDTRTEPEIMRDIACRVVKAFPFIANLRIVRIWGALRIMTPDGYPIYEESSSHPGVFVATCHSGVTLAAIHAKVLAQELVSGGLSQDLGFFSGERFNVPAN